MFFNRIFMNTKYTDVEKYIIIIFIIIVCYHDAVPQKTTCPDELRIKILKGKFNWWICIYSFECS